LTDALDTTLVCLAGYLLFEQQDGDAPKTVLVWSGKRKGTSACSLAVSTASCPPSATASNFRPYGNLRAGLLHRCTGPAETARGGGRRYAAFGRCHRLAYRTPGGGRSRTRADRTKRRTERKKSVTGFQVLGLPTVGNIEGMTWGSILPVGERTLLLVGDDNFAHDEVTPESSRSASAKNR
jgi:hypothetical protein